MSPVGAYCDNNDCGETTPFLWNGTLHVAEHHTSFRIRRQALPGCVGAACDNSMVIEDIPNTASTSFVSALVVDKTLWVFGTTPGWEATQVDAFWSKTPEVRSSWQNATVMTRASANLTFTAFNTSPHKGMLGGKPVYVLAVEFGAPEPLVGVPYTAVFAAKPATDDDLSTGWRLLDPTKSIYRKDRYSACPTLRYFGGWWYVVVLFEGVANPHGANCSSRSTEFTACLAQHVARTRDFLSWQEPTQSTEGGAPGNASIIMGLPDGSGHPLQTSS